ncbi:DUF3375 domain-containing protein [Paeniglutamicibacter gangotriensis]|uniref:DUF3375 domain-containing protein n=1 Tax=Paeniglutamicibacter gangotriensis Lz1y TaxID=1276920 RepID=M7N7Z2_9MICC|nr:DUF3375 domain-containing protein [Paeniglutamicibacter gangotriensis]EMQ97899.1 hypothetical protein ADIAG_02842 [Paeniglutamicibacter gangotriensis Lz1y]
MRPTHQASPLWSQTQQFRSSAAWKLLSTAPWAVAFLRAEFTSAKPRVGLEVFHASLESFLKVVRSEDPSFNDSMSASQYADAWVRNQFLARPLVDGHFVYEPTAQTSRVLKFLADFSGDRTNLNSSRLNTLLTSLESLAHETDPDPEARIRALEAEITQRQEKIASLRDGTTPAVLPREGALAATRSVLDMASGLPADFKRMRDGVQEMLHALRGEIMESSSVKGVAVGAVLEGDKQLRSTPQGETFRGFTEFLNSPEAQVRFREAVNEVLERDFVDSLDAQERHTLANLLRELRRQASEVHQSYGRLSESLHAYVQSAEFKEAAILREAVRAAEIAVSSSRVLHSRTPVAPIKLYAPRFTSIAALGIYDPDEHVAPPKLAAPPQLSVADIRRTPSTPSPNIPVLHRAITDSRAKAGGTVKLADTYNSLDAEHRHLNTLRYLIETARNGGDSIDESTCEEISFTQVNGTTRIALVPAMSFTKDPA